MDKETKQRIEKAKAPVWKKILIWSGAILGIITLLGIAIIMAVRKTGPSEAVASTLRLAKDASAKADIEAKIRKAEALIAEKEVLDKLKEIKEIDDEEERAKRLADMF